jgi:hypothetical protein
MMVTMPVGRAVLLGGAFKAKSLDLDTGIFHDNLSAATYARSISTDGRWLVSTEPLEPSKKCGVKIWDLTTGELRHVVPLPGNKWPRGICISPDGKRLAADHAPPPTADPSTQSATH